MLPKPVYESLPYINIVVGALLTLLQLSLVTAACGLLLYFAGAGAWVQRSKHRRKDRINANIVDGKSRAAGQYRKKTLIPTTIYEYEPFAFVLAGLLMMSLAPAFGLIAVAGGIFVVVGSIILLLRAISRSAGNRRQVRIIQ